MIQMTNEISSVLRIMISISLIITTVQQVNMYILWSDCP